MLVVPIVHCHTAETLPLCCWAAHAMAAECSGLPPTQQRFEKDNWVHDYLLSDSNSAW
jgi:hypothetical protein